MEFQAVEGIEGIWQVAGKGAPLLADAQAALDPIAAARLEYGAEGLVLDAAVALPRP